MDGIYLQVDAQGFIGPYGGSQPHLEAIRALRAFSGLGLALGLFEVSSDYLPQSPPSDILLHRQDAGGEFVAVRTISLDDGISRTIKRLRLSGFIDLLGDPKRRSQFVTSTFFLIQAALSGGKKADLIFLASQWFFDGHSHGSDQLLKFVQTMIVLEILLGDKASSDQTGLNVLLRNRCAYLIGTSQEDRAEVLEWFRKIYDVRSEIVHTGKHALSTSELELFARLRWICRRVIRKEIELLRADQGKG
nr:HEPN domain-containing protein [Bradyrhizobium sp. IC3123]